MGILYDSSVKRKAGEPKQTYKFCEGFGLEGINRVLLEMICHDSPVDQVLKCMAAVRQPQGSRPPFRRAGLASNRCVQGPLP